MLTEAEKSGGFSSRIYKNFPNGVNYDVKLAYHVVRLLNEVEQILVEQNLDLERNREQLKDIRAGNWTLEQIEQYFNDKEKLLEEVYLKSTLPYGPDEDAIKQLLLDCLEQHYGSLTGVVVVNMEVDKLANDIRAVLSKYGYNG